jgi:hypothetical protein
LDSDITGQARQRALAHARASATNWAAKERSPHQAENENGRFVPGEARGHAFPERHAAAVVDGHLLLPKQRQAPR